VDFRETEATFIRFGGAFFLRDDRVDENELVLLLFRFATRVEHKDAIRQIDLVCRQSDSVIGVHDREHFGDNIPQLLINTLDRFALVAKNRMGIFDDLETIHGNISQYYCPIGASGSDIYQI